MNPENDLIERYLGAIARNLPEGQKGDVIAELRDVLLTQVDEATERLGRAPGRAEIEALLIKFGHPLSVAGRYRKVQHLIGPEIFPFWWAAVKLVLGVIIGLWVLGFAFEALAGHAVALIPDRFDASLGETLIFAFGAVTLVCMLLERFGKTALLQDWKPSQLPPPDGQTKSRFDRVLEIAMALVFVLWWTGVVDFGNVLPGGNMSVRPAPVWDQFHGLILVYAGFDIGANVLGLLRPGAVALNRAVSMAGHLFGAALMAALLPAGRWLVVQAGAFPGRTLAEVQGSFDLGMRIAIGAALLLMLGLAALDGWRLWQSRARLAGAPVRA